MQRRETTKQSIIPLRRWLQRDFRAHRSLNLIIVMLIATGVCVAIVVNVAGKALFSEQRFVFGSSAYVLTLPDSVRNSQDLTAFQQGLSKSVGAGSAKNFGVVCDKNVPVGGLASPVAFRMFDTKDQVAKATVKSSVVVSNDQVLASPALLNLLGRSTKAPYGAISVDGTTKSMVGLVNNPDDARTPLIVGTLPASFDGANCSLLISGGAALEQQVLSYYHQSYQSVPAVQNKNEATGTSILRPLTTALDVLVLALVAIATAAGFNISAERMRSELAALLALGAAPVNLRKILATWVLTVSLIGCLVGVVVGTPLAHVIADGLIRSQHRVVQGMLISVSAIAIPIVVALAVTLIAGLRPALQILRGSTVAAMHDADSGWRRRKSTLIAAILGMLLVVGATIGLLSGRKSGDNSAVLFAVLLGLGPLLMTSGLLGLPSRVVTKASLLQLSSRQLSRHRKRAVSVAVLGAISVGLSLAVVMTTYTLNVQSTTHPELRKNQAMLTAHSGWADSVSSADTTFEPTQGLSAGMVTLLRETVPKARITQVQRVLNTTTADAVNYNDRGSLVLAQSGVPSQQGGSQQLTVDEVPLYVATPELQDALGAHLDPDSTDTVEVYTGRAKSASHANITLYANRQTSQVVDASIINEPHLDTQIAPAALISQRDAERWGRVIDAGALLTSDHAFTSTERNALQRFANANGLRVAVPENTRNNVIVMWSATAFAALFGLLVTILGANLLALAGASDDELLYALGVNPYKLRTLYVLRTLLIGVVVAVLAIPLGYIPVLGGMSNLTPPPLSPPILPLVVIFGSILAGVPLSRYLRQPAQV